MSELNKILNIENESNLRRFKKGEFIQQPNQLKANAIYVKKGLIRSYIIDSSGKEQNTTFYISQLTLWFKRYVHLNAAKNNKIHSKFNTII